MIGGTVRFSLEGLSLERLLNQCVESGIVLTDVQRPRVRLVVATVSSSQFGYIKTLAKKYDWKLNVKRITGLPKLLSFAWRRAMLVSGVAVFVTVAWFLCNCIWSIQIYNAGPYQGEVRQILLENEVKPGRFSTNIDVEELRTILARRLSGLAWVSVSIDGVRLRVYCVQGVPRAESSIEDKGKTAGDVYAARDGVIESIRVAAGTAQVKQGEVVQKGQLLVKGEERSWNGEVNQVAARAEALARVWYTAEVVAPLTELVTIPTGYAQTRKVYVTPWYEWSPTNLDGFYNQFEGAQAVDAQARNVLIGGILPIWMRIEDYEEVTLEQRERDMESLKYETALAAQRKAHELAGVDKTIVDKWVEYSIIEDENSLDQGSGMGSGLKAHLTLEVVENIAKNP